MDKETRFRPGSLEIRAEAGGGQGRISGYAIVFDELSDNLGGFREKISPEAVSSVDFSDTVALFNHNSSQVLGSMRSGTLLLETDSAGVRFSLDVPDTSYGRDLYEMVSRGDISGASFGFFIGEGGDSWEMGYDDIPIRTVTGISSVPEVSVGVVFPAYPQSSTTIQRCKEFESQLNGRAGIESATRLRKLRLLELGA